MGQFEPSAGKRIGEQVGIFVIPLRDGAVDRVHTESQVGCGHHRTILFRRIVGIGNHVFFLNVLGQPLPCPGWAFHQFPFVAEKCVEVAHVPFRGIGFPSSFNSAAGGIDSDTRAKFVLPAQTHFFHGCAFGFATDEFGVARSVTFSKGVATCNESHCFFVVHGHARECFADVSCRP